MGQALLLTGRPGIGKTTVIREVARRLGARAGGFYTEEIRTAGKRTGFRLVGLPEGRATAALLASVNERGRYRVGRYSVHLDNLERVGVAAIRQAVHDAAVSVVVIDEIGRMELYSAAFRQAVLQALNSRKPLVATIMAGRDEWVDAIRARAGVAQVRVTAENRQSLPEQVLAWLARIEGVSPLEKDTDQPA